MRNALENVLLASLFGLAAGCADPAPADDDAGTSGGARADAAANGGAPSGGAPSGGAPVEPVGGAPSGGAPVERDAMVEPTVDAEAPRPDAVVTPRPAALVAAVVLTEQPQVPAATLSARVTAAGELPNQSGCVAVPFDPNAQAAPAQGYDAGAISLAGARSALELTPSVGGAGVDYTVGGGVPDDLFDDNARLVATAQGGAHLGAFEVAVNAPRSVNVRSPQAQFGAQQSVNDDLVVEWAAGESESLLVTLLPAQLIPSVEPQAGQWVFCSVPDAEGTVTIPAAQVAAVGDNPGVFGQGALLIVTRTRVGTTTLGPDTAAITASTSQGVPVTLVQ